MPTLPVESYGAVGGERPPARDSPRESPGITEGGRRAIFLSALLAALVISEGYDVGVLNGAMVIISADLGLNVVQASLLVTVAPFCVIPGSLVGGHLADKLGRIRALQLSSVALCIGPLGMAASASLWSLVLFRALVGTGIGAALVGVSMYIAEVSPPELRGRLIAVEEVGITLGIVLGYAANSAMLGIKDDWRWMLGVGCVLPLMVGLLLFLPQVPESPRWLFQHGQEREAEAVLRLFVTAEEAQTSIKQMRELRAELWDMRSPRADVAREGKLGFGAWYQALEDIRADPKVARMFLAGTVVAVMQMCCGVSNLVYYSGVVLKSAMSTREAFQLTLLMGLSKVLFLGITLLVFETVGRRFVLLLSCAGVTLANFYLCAAFAAGLGKWALAFGLVAFAAGHAIGLGPVTYVYLSEVFGTEWRGKGIGVALSVSRVIAVMTTFVFPLLVEAAGVSVTFLAQAALCVLLSLLVYTFAYETGGHSLEVLSKKTPLA